MQRDLSGRFQKGTNGNTFEGWGIWLDNKGYPCIWIDGRRVRLHVFVWERANGSKPKGGDVHHIDFDRHNFRLDNLELLTKSDHAKLHAGWIRKNEQWVAKRCTRCKQIFALANFYLRKGYTPTALCKRCTNEVTTAHNKLIPEKRAIYNRRWYERKKVMCDAKE